MIPSRRTIPWATVIRGLCEKYGWTPDDVGRLTMYQAMVMAGLWCPEDIWQNTRKH